MRSVSSPFAVSITIGTGASAWIRRHTSSPSRPGSIRSSTTRSGGSARAGFEPGLAVGTHLDDGALALEVGGDHLGDVGVVVDDEHALTIQGRHGRSLRTARDRRRRRLPASSALRKGIARLIARTSGAVCSRAPPHRRQAAPSRPRQDPAHPRVRTRRSRRPGRGRVGRHVRRGPRRCAPIGWWCRSRATRPASSPPDFEVVAQRAGTFAERLAGAWEDAGGRRPPDRHGHAAAHRAHDLDDALGQLRAPGTDAVLGPAIDGGWWAIGLPRPHGWPLRRHPHEPARHRRPPARPPARARPRASHAPRAPRCRRAERRRHRRCRGPGHPLRRGGRRTARSVGTAS